MPSITIQPNAIRIVDFEPKFQAEAAALINTGLGEHFGHIDESMNPDLFDIHRHYLAEVFLLAFVGGQLVGTGALTTVDNQVGQISRMHTAAAARRQGVASRILRALEQRARTRHLKTVILETNLDWDDAIALYNCHGYKELARNEEGIRYAKSLT